MSPGATAEPDGFVPEYRSKVDELVDLLERTIGEWEQAVAHREPVHPRLSRVMIELAPQMVRLRQVMEKQRGIMSAAQEQELSAYLAERMAASRIRERAAALAPTLQKEPQVLDLWMSWVDGGSG